MHVSKKHKHNVSDNKPSSAYTSPAICFLLKPVFSCPTSTGRMLLRMAAAVNQPP
jgi:hypothetical protein